jgi:class 3 adenylate cyclase
VDLRPKSFEVLRHLVEHAGRVVGKEEVIEAVWPDVTVTDESLTHCISEIRRALGDGSQRIIKTVSKRGYLFDVPVLADDVMAAPVPRAAKTGAVVDSVPTADPLPEQGAELIDGGTPAGERKHVTVLCADLKRPLELVAQRDPEEALKVFESVLKLMPQAVHRYEGTINMVTGDGILALFGTPLAHEDHAIRACYAALEIQEAVKRYVPALQHAAGIPISVRAGLNSGEVVIRSIASGMHTQRRAMGQTIHVAERLGQIAPPGALLVSAETLRLAEGHVQAKALDHGNMTALNEQLYELVGVGQAQTRFQAALATRGLTDFVGRDAEMDQLERVHAKAGRGHGQVVTIIGEPGLGKSRLLHEFVRAHRTSRWRMLETVSVSYRRATSYLPVIELLKTYFEIESSDDAHQMREKVIGGLLDLDRNLAPDQFSLLALLDIPVEEPAWQLLDTSQRRQRTLDALKRLILRESQRQPLVLVFEDLHWIDGETQAFLEALIDGLASAPLLLILTYRPEYQHRWGSKSYYTQLRLDVLPPEMTAEFLRNLLGEDASLTGLKKLLSKQGNPFFLEESIRTLIETNVLDGERGRYRLVHTLQELRIPPAVQAILAARIDRMPARDKRLLQAASVIGKDVPYAILQPLSGLREDDLGSGLGQLQEAEFLYQTRLFPEVEYTFKHALTHEVSYGSLLAEQRRVLHRQTVDVIERLFPERLTEHVEQLAHHAHRGELWERAVGYWRKAGAKAFARSSNREALRCFDQALAALTHLAETRQTREQAIDIRCDLRNALYPLAEYGKIERYLREAEDLAQALDDRRRLGWVSAYMSSLYLTTGGHATEAGALAQRAKVIAEALGELPLHDAAQYYLAWANYIAGDFRGTERICRSLMSSVEGDRSRERFGVVFPAVQSRTYIALALAQLGDFDEGDAQGRDAIRLAEELDHPFSLSWACLGLAHIKSRRGELSQAASLLERALDQCQHWSIGVQAPIVMALLGHVYAWSERVEEGVSLLQQAVTDYKALGTEHHLSISIVQLGDAYLLAARVEDARACADRAVTVASRRGERGFEAWAFRLLGDIALHKDSYDGIEAEAHYRAAMALASELGMRPLAAHCHLGLGKLYRRSGKSELAHEHLGTAAAMYREMNMRFWLESMQAETVEGE